MVRWIGLALSGLMIMTLPACHATAGVGSAGTAAPVAPKQLPALLASARAAIARADSATAVRDAEAAVAIEPRRAESRALLGRAYLAAGRFGSARTAFGDALTIDPGLGRVAVTRALAQIALGDTDGALASLRIAGGQGSEADIGLALALAGRRDEAIERLEAAARSIGATPQVRQNLALAYALQGRWNEASATAARDIPPEQLAARMRRWSQIAQHSDEPPVQVAMLLGVLPMPDRGQPEALALAPPAAPVQTAIADAAPAAVSTPAAIPMDSPGSATSIVAVRIRLPTMFAHAVAMPPLSLRLPPALRPMPAMAQYAPAKRLTGDGFVVQLGAFSSARRGEAAWNRLSGKARYLAGYTLVGSGLRRGSATLYRLSLSGFTQRRDARHICARIKAMGGACFVRAASGDRPVQWVQRRDEGEAA